MRGSFRSQSLAVAAFAILLPAVAHAQQSGTSSNRLMFDSSSVQGAESRTTLQQQQPQTTGQGASTRQTAAPAPSQPATASKPAARTTTASVPPRPAAQRRPAQPEAANQNATDTTRTSERPIPREQPGSLGRIDLSGGSVGYDGRTSMQPYNLGDGRRVPGTDNIQRNDSSYFGLSLRMPTSSSSGTIFGRPD